MKKITILILSLALLLGAACRYPSVERSPDADSGIHSFIEGRFEEFLVSFSGDAERPGAIFFDLKGDDAKLLGRGWRSVTDKQQVHSLADAMAREYRLWGFDALGPRLSVILDTDRRPLGYIYSPVRDPSVWTSGKDFYVEAIGPDEIIRKANPGIRGAGG